MELRTCGSLAQIQILLIPVGSIRQSTYEKWAAEVRAFEEIRLGDIPTDSRDERARFMPSPLSTGHLHLSFPLIPPPHAHQSFGLLRPSHFPLAAVGIASCSQADSLSGILAQFNASVAEIFPPGSVFPLARSCFAFEEEDGNTNLNIGEHLSGLVVIPSLMGNKKLYIGTLVADLCSNILAEFSSMVKSLESSSGTDMLNATLFPKFSSLSDGSDNLVTHDVPHLTTTSQPNLALRSRSPISVDLAKRTYSFGPSSSNLDNQGGIPPLTISVKKRQSTLPPVAAPGRLYKILGDFFLLSGRTMDAAIWYNEAIALFKSPQDAIWHASALEGMVVTAIVDAWAADHGLNPSQSSSSSPWSELSAKLSQATMLYSRVMPGSESREELSLLTYLYCSSCFRHSELLFAIWSAKGWGPLAFTAMLHPGPAPYVAPILSYGTAGSVDLPDRLSAITGIAVFEIAGILSQFHGPWLLHLDFRDRLEFLQTAAGLYSCLNLRRKETFMLREVLLCIVTSIILDREEPDILGATSSASIGLGISLNDDGTMTPLSPHIAAREQDTNSGNSSLLKIMTHICMVLGIDVEAVKLYSEGNDSARNVVDYFPNTPFLWPELQVGIAREAVEVTEVLPDHVNAVTYSLSILRSLRMILRPDDQYYFYLASSRGLSTARRRADEWKVHPWFDNPITAVYVKPLPDVRAPFEKANPDARRIPGDQDSMLLKPSVFYHKPRVLSPSSGKKRMLVVQNERIEVIVSIHNPWAIALELQSVTLSTEGVPFNCKNVSVVIAPGSSQQLEFSGEATEAGSLIIRGCIIQAPGCIPQEFKFPYNLSDTKTVLPEVRSTSEHEGRTKISQLSSRLQNLMTSTKSGTSSGTDQLNQNPDSGQFLTLRVVPIQPLLRIRRTSLTHGAVMLYSGETSTIRLTMENISSLPIDYLLLSFEDSVRQTTEQLLSENTLSASANYEAEYDLLHKPVLSWDSNDRVQIPPGKEITITVACYGKVSCNNATIFFEYAYRNRNKESLSTPLEVFCTRQLYYPISFTVYQMLECRSLGVIPLSMSAASSTAWFASWIQELRKDTATSWCLFTIDVRNTYGSPFEVTFTAHIDNTSTEDSHIVAPGTTRKFMLPIKRFLISKDGIKKPIPVLTDRQFVVSKPPENPLEREISHTHSQEMFWYREQLLQMVKGKWREAGGTRSGELSLRNQPLTFSMINVLREDFVKLQVSLTQERDGEQWNDGTKIEVQPHVILSLKLKATNLTPSSALLTLNANFEPAEYVVYNGALQGISIGEVANGESGSSETSICFTAEGEYSLTADVIQLGSKRHSLLSKSEVRVVVRNCR